jgi:predicted transcriptional regulator
MLNEAKDENPEISEKGKIVLKCLQDHPDIKLWKAKDIADMINITSRGASGSMRKLVHDGFCDKMGESPAVYCLTEKGKNYEIN